jgi:hypothetical protein
MNAKNYNLYLFILIINEFFLEHIIRNICPCDQMPLPSFAKFLSFNLNLKINIFPINSCITLGTSSLFPCTKFSNSDTVIFRSLFASSSNMVHVVLVV